jgi:hypothetical protein
MPSLRRPLPEFGQKTRGGGEKNKGINYDFATLRKLNLRSIRRFKLSINPHPLQPRSAVQWNNCHSTQGSYESATSRKPKSTFYSPFQAVDQPKPTSAAFSRTMEYESDQVTGKKGLSHHAIFSVYCPSQFISVLSIRQSINLQSVTPQAALRWNDCHSTQ